MGITSSKQFRKKTFRSHNLDDSVHVMLKRVKQSFKERIRKAEEEATKKKERKIKHQVELKPARLVVLYHDDDVDVSESSLGSSFCHSSSSSSCCSSFWRSPSLNGEVEVNRQKED